MAPVGCMQNGSGVWSLHYPILSYSERERIGEVIRQTLTYPWYIIYILQSLIRAWTHFKLVNSTTYNLNEWMLDVDHRSTDRHLT